MARLARGSSPGVCLGPSLAQAVVRFSNQPGTAEQWIKEGKEATHWTRLSCHSLGQVSRILIH